MPELPPSPKTQLSLRGLTPKRHFGQNFLADVEITEVRDSVVLGSYRFLDPAGVPIARTVAFEARKCREPAPGG